MATPQGRRLGYHTPKQVSKQEPPDSRPCVLTTTLLGARVGGGIRNSHMDGHVCTSGKYRHRWTCPACQEEAWFITKAASFQFELAAVAQSDQFILLAGVCGNSDYVLLKSLAHWVQAANLWRGKTLPCTALVCRVSCVGIIEGFYCFIIVINFITKLH